MRRAVLVAFALVLVGCSHPNTASSARPVSHSSGVWLRYAGPAASVDPTPGAFRRPHLLWRSPPLDGDVYARPLIARGRVFTATQNDTVYALDSATGRILWQSHVGTPVGPGMLPCGDIPTTGILGTPVLDPTGRRLYAVAFLRPGRHVLVAVDAATGRILARHAVDAPGANPLVHQQRAALAWANGRVYVAYGGLYGDCGDYHGQVVAADPATCRIVAHYRVPSVREGGIWAPGGMLVDPSGDLYVATGNSASDQAYDFGNAVIRLSPDLRVKDWFAPTDWRALNRSDLDIGSIAPTPVGHGLLFQIGKSGRGYLLRTSHLGHVGGQAFSAPVCRYVLGGTARDGGLVYVSCMDGLAALQVAPTAPSFKTIWRAREGSPGPPLVSHGAVWTVTWNGQLCAYARTSGRELFTTTVGRVNHFASPSAAGGRLFVPAARRIVAFSLGQ